MEFPAEVRSRPRDPRGPAPGLAWPFPFLWSPSPPRCLTSSRVLSPSPTSTRPVCEALNWTCTAPIGGLGPEPTPVGDERRRGNGGCPLGSALRSAGPLFPRCRPRPPGRQPRVGRAAGTRRWLGAPFACDFFFFLRRGNPDIVDVYTSLLSSIACCFMHFEVIMCRHVNDCYVFLLTRTFIALKRSSFSPTVGFVLKSTLSNVNTITYQLSSG